jgi:hypothetical protein
MSKNKYRILRLRSGEDVIGTITGKAKRKLIVQRPMQLKVSTLFNEKTSETQEVIFFRDWLKETTHTSARIPEDHIVTFLTPSEEIVALYESEMEREDCNPPKEKMNPLRMLKHLQEMQNKQEEETEGQSLSDHVEPQSIIVTLAIPPVIFMSMVANGLFQSEDMMDTEPTDEELGDIEREHERREQRRQQKKDQSPEDENPDYGNRFEDWPDKPEDIL